MTFAEDSDSGAAEPVPLRHPAKSNKEPSTRIKILQPAEDQADPIQRILQVPPKLFFKRLILETPLWQYAMSLNLKSPLEGLKPLECKKGKSVARPPIPYVPPLDLIEKRETEQIKVKMPDGTNFGMAAFAYRTNKDYLVHVIAVIRIIKKKQLASNIKVAWDAILKVRREMKPYFLFPEDEAEAAKEVQKQTLSKYKEILKAKKGFMIAKTQKAYKMFRCFVVGDTRTQWDKIVHDMHTKDPWIGVNGSSNKGPCIRF